MILRSFVQTVVAAIRVGGRSEKGSISEIIVTIKAGAVKQAMVLVQSEIASNQQVVTSPYLGFSGAHT